MKRQSAAIALIVALLSGAPALAAACHINEVHRIGDNLTQDQIEIEVFCYGIATGSREFVVMTFVAKSSTIAQFKTAIGNAIVSGAAALGITLTTADIGGHN